MLDVLTFQFDLLSKPVDPILYLILKNYSKIEWANLKLFNAIHLYKNTNFGIKNRFYSSSISKG